MVGVDEAGDRRLLPSAPRLRPWFSVGATEEVHTQAVPFSPFPSAPSPPLASPIFQSPILFPSTAAGSRVLFLHRKGGPYVRLLPSTAAGSRVLFLSASPHAVGSAVLLRAWILLRVDLFAPARLMRDLAQPALNLDLPHGLTIFDDYFKFFYIFFCYLFRVKILDYRLEKVVRVSTGTNSSSSAIVCAAFRAIFGTIAVDSGKADAAGEVFWKVHGGSATDMQWML